MPTRIVVLDAEPVVRSTIAAILRHGGYTVEPIETVEIALELVENAPPDLLLTNVYLPDMTGMEAMRRLREICPELRILMVSGMPDSEVIRQWICKDGVDTFPKPFAAQQLLEKVREMLAG